MTTIGNLSLRSNACLIPFKLLLINRFQATQMKCLIIGIWYRLITSHTLWYCGTDSQSLLRWFLILFCYNFHNGIMFRKRNMFGLKTLIDVSILYPRVQVIHKVVCKNLIIDFAKYSPLSLWYIRIWYIYRQLFMW